MSFKIAQTLPPNPATSRGTFTQLGTDPKGEKLVYCQSRTVIIRPLDSSASTIVYSQHAHPTTVARISPSGFYCASADVAGNVRVWDLAGDEQVLKLEIKALGGRITDLSWDGESKRIGVVGEGKDRWVSSVRPLLACRFPSAFSITDRAQNLALGHSSSLTRARRAARCRATPRWPTPSPSSLPVPSVP